MKPRFFLLCFILITGTGKAQKILTALDSLYRFYPQEKVVLTLSKPAYVSGEAIYFKANVLSGYDPSTISSTLYVELYTATGHLLKQQLVPLFNGSGEGSFFMPAASPENVYYLRAYTHYQLNYNAALQCIEQVLVYNPLSEAGLKNKPTAWAAKAFAEGGRLLPGVAGVVAVRLYHTGALPDSWQGTITEKEAPAPVAELTVYNSETGEATFTPAAGKEYVVRLRDSKGNTQIIPVPAVSSQGTSLITEVTDSLLFYTINTAGTTLSDGYFLLGTINDQVAFKGSIKKPGGTVSGKINIATLPPGVLQVTLFDAGGAAVNNRLCFIHLSDAAAASAVLTDTLSVAAKGYNHWRVAVDTALWLTYTVQVEDGATNNQNDFLADVYLRSDFATPILNAAAYFEKAAPEKAAALNALLLSESWQRFSWTDLLRGRYPTLRYLPENYLSFTGTVHKGRAMQPNRDINMILKGKDSSAQIMVAKTDTAGRFALDGMIFTDTVKVYYQANSRKFLEKDITLEFTPHNTFQPYTGTWPVPAMATVPRLVTDTLPVAIRRAIAQRNNEAAGAEKKMQEVVIRTRARNPTQELNEQLSTGLFSSINETVIDFINQDQSSAFGYANILQWLQGRVAGLTIQQQAGELVPFIRNSPATIYLDEMEITPDALSGFPVNEIAMIKVIKSGMLSSRSGGGGVAIYTRRGSMKSPYDQATLPTNTIVGYAAAQPFFMPDYSEGNSRSVPDSRLILYRNNTPQPDHKTGFTDVRFYNNDSARSFRITITGFSSNGLPVYYSQVVSGR